MYRILLRQSRKRTNGLVSLSDSLTSSTLPTYEDRRMKTSAGVPTVVRMLMARERMTTEGLAIVLGISRTSANNRLKGYIPFTADEIVKMANRFDVVPGTFFQDPAELSLSIRWSDETAGQDSQQSA